MKQPTYSIFDKLYEYLVEEPRARERSQHKRGVVNLLLKKAKFQELNHIDKNMLVMFCAEFESGTRAWRKILEEHPELRGNDYGEKEELELEKQRELGYPV